MFEFSQWSFSVSVFLWLYGLFMFFFLLYSAFNIYYLVRYGFYSASLYILMTVFSAGTLVLFALSMSQMMEYNWKQPIDLDRSVDFYNTELFPSL